MKKYPTDLSDNQWQFIKKALQLGERKRKHNLRTIWNAIHYLVKTGCQWRMLPLNFAKWQLVYYYYKKWSDLEQFDLLLCKLREHLRVKRAKRRGEFGDTGWSECKMGNNKALNSYDGNKKVKGIKRHVIVDKMVF